MKKVATFVRVSNFDTAQIAAYNQKKKLQDYCESKGYEVVDHADVIGDKSFGFPMLMKLLQNAKTNGVEKIVMQSTNRVTGTLDEVGQLAKLFYESGVGLETLDGSHDVVINPAKLVEAYLGSVESEDVYADTDEELVFGYDRTDDGLVVNESEMDVVKYCFARQSYFWKLNHSMSLDEITSMIESEVKEKWPVEYEALINKQRHNALVQARKHVNVCNVTESTPSASEPLISRDKWAEVQEKIAESQEDSGEETDEGEGMIPTM